MVKSTKRRESITSSVSSSGDSATKQLNRLVLMIAVTFIVCNSVEILSRCFEIFNLEIILFQNFVVPTFSNFLISLCASSNTLFFCLVGSKFRINFYNLFTCCKANASEVEAVELRVLRIRLLPVEADQNEVNV